MEIERLIYMNKEQIQEANDMEDEIDELEDMNSLLIKEKKEIARDLEKFKNENSELRTEIERLKSIEIPSQNSQKEITTNKSE